MATIGHSDSTPDAELHHGALDQESIDHFLSITKDQFYDFLLVPKKSRLPRNTGWQLDEVVCLWHFLIILHRVRPIGGTKKLIRSFTVDATDLRMSSKLGNIHCCQTS
ncbi:hypothetical protein VNO77_02926 [Canavalia gladiata]|uniref:Uncharacterized protein n=1 Tax=Canavalia gladiata TaxID=3824 RepID=A0AAN9N0B9_CANGL